jgi:methylated-DNA-[protein]-cysteine S-methyltransferase
MKLNFGSIESPIGALVCVTDQQGLLRALDFADHRLHLYRGLREHYADFEHVDTVAPLHIVDALQRYFSGEINALESMAIAAAGNELQTKVWNALRGIPAGQTTSYGALARKMGYDDPRMAIEVGTANGANPIAIVVPCHRVVASNGDLKGYVWGLHRKPWLLRHEGALPAKPPAPVTSNQAPRLPGF